MYQPPTPPEQTQPDIGSLFLTPLAAAVVVGIPLAVLHLIATALSGGPSAAKTWSPIYAIAIATLLGFIHAVVKLFNNAHDYRRAWEAYRAEMVRWNEEQSKREAARKAQEAHEAEREQRYRKALATWEIHHAVWVKGQVYFREWHEQSRQAWAEVEQKAYHAATLFESTYRQIDSKLRMEMNFTDKAAILKIFREAITDLAREHPELGLLRYIERVRDVQPGRHIGGFPPWATPPYTFREIQALTHPNSASYKAPLVLHPMVAANFPKLAGWLDDERLEAVRDVLPPIPVHIFPQQENRPTNHSAEPKRPDAP